ncbi:class I histocompatibility antigen, F10 alpha chain-like [Chanos chanos]|uniref:Class I histocompatibility antigen, F10 alpha chain-like n=1 Tax=Chanos chanos TaxID=29144 RepID=A0A6J2W4S4_CHACN|nr:class I histocompatibility antigen, F10 alpha chain-like [Chanos chanos]
MYDTVVNHMFSSLQIRTPYLKEQCNSTDEIQVYQRIVGCELLDTVDSGEMKGWDSFNGLLIGTMSTNMEPDSLQFKIERFGVYGLNLEVSKWNTKYVYYPFCIKTLKRFLEEEKNRVKKKVKPRVRLVKKTLAGTGRIQVTCLATGFYPRHINLTLLRDGQSVSEDQITGGILLPNVDDTYQMRKSLEVKAQEFRLHNYSCSVVHLSLDNKLDIAFDHDANPSMVPIWWPFLVVLFVLVIVPVAGFIIWRRCAGVGVARP